MTKDTNKENALKVIRYIQSNVEGLKELSFGCEITNCVLNGDEMPNGVVVKDVREKYLYLHIDAGDQLEYQVHYNDKFTFEIIGHEVQLNHLLLAIGNAEIEQDIEDLYMEVLNRYDLTKTVQQNLESNTELCQYLLDLLQLTTNN